MDVCVYVEERLDCILSGRRGHRCQILTAKLRAISTATDTGISAESDLSPVHDGRIVGYEIVTVFAVFGNDRVPHSPSGIVGSVTGTVALVDLEQALADKVGAEVTDAVSSLAWVGGGGGHGCGGCGVHYPRVGEDFLNGDS